MLHNPDRSPSQHQVAGHSCPFVNRSEAGSHPASARSSFYDPVHGPSGPWLSPPPYHWPHPPSGIPPHALPPTGPLAPSTDAFYSPIPGAPVPINHQTPSFLAAYPYNTFPPSNEHPNFRPGPPNPHRMSAPSGLPGSSAMGPGAPTQPPQPPQDNWRSRPFGGMGGMSPPGSLRYSSSLRRHEGRWTGGNDDSPSTVAPIDQHSSFAPEPPHGPGIFTGAPFPAPRLNVDPPPARRMNFGFESLRPGQAAERPPSPGKCAPGDRV